MTVRRHLLLPLACVLVPLAAGAGPWARGSGHLFAKLTYSDLRTEKLVTLDGNKHDIPQFTLQQLTFFGDVGIGEHLTASVDLPLFRRSEIDHFDSASGVGDLRIGLQAQLADVGDWRIAVRGVVQTPTGDEAKGGGLLPTGGGVWELESMLSVGRTFATGRGYGFVELGHDARGGDLRDGLLYEGQLGYSLCRRLSVHGFVRGLEPWDDTKTIGVSATSAGLGDGSTYMTVGGGLSILLAHGVALELELDAMPHARNIAPGPTARVGVSVLR